MADTQYLEDDLKLRVEDPDGIAFSVGNYESVLNYATQQAIDMVHPIHLTSCAEIETTTANAGVLPFSDLGIDNAKQIIAIQDQSAGADFELTHHPIDIVNQHEYRQSKNNKYYEGSSDYPVAYPSPGGAGTASMLISPTKDYNVAVTVIKNPTGMGTGEAGYDIPSSVKDIVLDFAES